MLNHANVVFSIQMHLLFLFISNGHFDGYNLASASAFSFCRELST